MKKKTNSAFHNWKLISRNFSEVDSDLPQDIRDEALMCFEAAVSNRMAIGDAIQKVQKDVLSKCDERFKGQRYKGFIKFDFDTNVISITVSKIIFRRKKCHEYLFIVFDLYHFLFQINKFAGGNCQFQSGIGTKKMVCPDPFMGRLSDPNMHR